MNIRFSFRAGSFYEGTATSCRHHADKLLATDSPADLPPVVFGGLVPHAGWSYSGRLAAKTFKALDAAGPPQTVVLLGADHCGVVRAGEVYDSGLWRTPLGDVPIDEEIAEALLAAGGPLRANPSAHEHEHSIEVQVPLIKALWPDAKIVPIAVPPTSQAVQIGRVIGETLTGRFDRARVVGSTDLTHHGGHFPAPGGRGSAGQQWARDNDRKMIELIESMSAEQIIPQAQANNSACGAGAIAAAITACSQMGATRGICLEYTNSYEIVHALYPDEADDTTVGYASVVFV